MTTPPGSCKHPGQPFGPNNPPRLRKPGESVEEYRIAMGWDKPAAWPHCSSGASVHEAARAWIATWPVMSDEERLKMAAAFRAGVTFAQAAAAGVEAPHGSQQVDDADAVSRAADEFDGIAADYDNHGNNSEAESARARAYELRQVLSRMVRAIGVNAAHEPKDKNNG